VSQRSSIEWTDVSWNPVHGCSKVSPGCDHCYAETLSLRYGHTKKPWEPTNAAENVMLKPHKLKEPLGIKEPSRIFVNSMSDVFHPRVPSAFIDEMWGVMARCQRHTFQILTKRPKRMREWCRGHASIMWKGLIGSARCPPPFGSSRLSRC
jgi:protein gp37